MLLKLATDTGDTATQHRRYTLGFLATFAPEGKTPTTVLWNFAGGATRPTVIQPNPTVSFHNAGTFTVTLTWADAHNRANPTPAAVHITVQAAQSNGGGGCTLQLPSRSILSALCCSLWSSSASSECGHKENVAPSPPYTIKRHGRREQVVSE